MQRDGDQSRIVLEILESVDRDGVRPQRRRASEVGIALGLVNAYLKYCIRKGYLRARRISPRVYQYMLTPTGFAEKSRLALQRLTQALGLLNASRNDFAALFTQAKERGWSTVVIVSASQLAEICTICALEREIRVAGIVDPRSTAARMLGLPVLQSFAAVGEAFDGVVIAELDDPGTMRDSAIAELGAEHVLTPRFLNIPARARSEVEAVVTT